MRNSNPENNQRRSLNPKIQRKCNIYIQLDKSFRPSKVKEAKKEKQQKTKAITKVSNQKQKTDQKSDKPKTEKLNQKSK